MRLDQRIGGAPLLAVICLCVVYWVFGAMGKDTPREQAATAASQLPLTPGAAAHAGAPVQRLDLSRPVQTARGALVCPQEVLLRAMASPRAADSLAAVYDAFTSVFNRREKAERAGCDEWRAGVPALNASRMQPPFEQFVGFALSNEPLPRGYFTLPSNLENAPPRPRPAQQVSAEGAHNYGERSAASQTSPVPATLAPTQSGASDVLRRFEAEQPLEEDAR